MAKTKTRPYDAAEFLNTEEKQAAFLSAALEENDPGYFTYALGNVSCHRNLESMDDDGSEIIRTRNHDARTAYPKIRMLRPGRYIPSTDSSTFSDEQNRNSGRRFRIFHL